MSKPSRKSAGVGLHTVLDVVLISLGLMMALGWTQFPTIPVVFLILIGFFAAVTVASDNPVIRRIAIAVMVFSLYMISRSIGVIDLPWLQYGAAILLIVVGVMGITRDLITQYKWPAAD